MVTRDNKILILSIFLISICTGFFLAYDYRLTINTLKVSLGTQSFREKVFWEGITHLIGNTGQKSANRKQTYILFRLIGNKLFHENSVFLPPKIGNSNKDLQAP